ncbi:hypothetical protein [Pendulispora albinea]|uniref:PEGA domain-containing protein n=1 Tax=Pendulispora albinea TaxID=2741071 RepID=A0ABZ2M8R8_9BACT
MKPFFVFATLLLTAASVHAQPAPPTPTYDPSAIAAARSLGVEGVRLADAGNCQEAIAKLERAERLHHAPTTLGRLGECHIALGRLVLGSEQLQRVVREPLAAAAPAAFVTARARAKRTLDDVLPRIAKLHVHVEAKADAKPRVTLDGEPLSAEWLDIDRPIDPGAHTITAAAEGYAMATSTVTLAEGERSEVNLGLTPTSEPRPEAPPIEPSSPKLHESEPSARGGAAAPKPEPNFPPASKEPSPWTLHRTAGVVALGVGGGAVIVGSIFGLLALDTKGKLDDVCDSGKACPPDQNGRISALETQSVISTVGFVVGGVGIAAGAILLLTEPPSTTKPGSALSIGPASITWQGRF